MTMLLNFKSILGNVKKAKETCYWTSGIHSSLDCVVSQALLKGFVQQFDPEHSEACTKSYVQVLPKCHQTQVTGYVESDDKPPT